ncbi:MAG: hypothetical protein KF906_11255 [Actinobacteria bacterium]|nr:hypothetical protein [Actinomycetota bacterium]
MTDEGPEAGGPPRWEPSGDLYQPGDGDVQDPTVAHDVLGEHEPEPSPDPGATRAVPAASGGPAADPTPTPESTPVVPPPPPTDGSYGEDDDGDGEGPDDPDAARRKRLIIAAVVLGILAVALVVALIVSAGGDDGGTATTTSTSAPSTTTTTALQGEVELAPGVVAIIPEGSLTPGARLVATAVPVPAGLDALVAAGPVVDLQVEDGEILGPIDLVFTLSGAPTAPSGGEPLVRALRSASSGTALGDGVLDAAASTFAIEVDAPGVVGPLTWRWDDFVEQARTSFRGVAEGDADDPAAGGCADDVGDEVTVTATGDGIGWCAERDGDDRRIVAVNEASFPITVRWTGSVDATRRAGTGTASDLLGQIPDWSVDGALTLAPGERADLVVAPGEAATITSVVDDPARAGAALLGDVAFVAAISDDLPRSDGSGTVQSVLDRVDPACARSGSAAHELLAACFPQSVLASIAGDWTATAAAGLMEPTALGVVVDAAADDVGGTLTRRAAGSVEVVVATQTSWPVGEDRTNRALLDWLDGQSLLHQWARCAGAYCVAGIDDRVALVTVRGGVVVDSVSIDAAVDDPFDALVAAGLTDDDAAALVVSD